MHCALFTHSFLWRQIMRHANFIQLWNCSKQNTTVIMLLYFLTYSVYLATSESEDILFDNQQNISHFLRDAFKKKNFIWREKFLTCLPPPPPTKVGNKTLGNFLVVLDPLPPYKSRKIYSFLSNFRNTTNRFHWNFSKFFGISRGEKWKIF